MSFTKLSKSVLNVSALPDKVSNQAQALKATFDKAGVDIKDAHNGLIDQLEAITGAGNIGALDGENSTTVQAFLNLIKNAIGERYTKEEAEALVGQETNDLIKTFHLDLSTGIMTVIKKDGTIETFDTALEKIPATFEFVENEGVYKLKIINQDGTVSEVNVTELFNIYNFINSNEIAFTTTTEGNTTTVSATIRDNSIGLEKLSLTVISKIEEYTQSAASSASSAEASATTATNKAIETRGYCITAETSMELAQGYATEASASETSAKNSKEEAQMFETAARTSMNNARSSETSAETYADNALTNANLAIEKANIAINKALEAQSYAVGGTGTREGEDTDNAKYYKELAENNTFTSEDKEKLDELSAYKLEASETNIIDFNTLTEPGVYVIKNCGVNTTLNGDFSNTLYLYDIVLYVVKTVTVSTSEIRMHQIIMGSGGIPDSIRTYMSGNWGTWGGLLLDAAFIGSGTFPRGIKCNTPTQSTHLANKDYVDTAIANIPEPSINLVDGTAEGSLRGVNTIPETSTYSLGEGAVAIGYYTKASGHTAYAEGYLSEASGTTSHAEGVETKASNAYTHAEGQSTTASGIASHAEGVETTASEEAAHAEGYDTKATGQSAHAEGVSTTASGFYAHAEGNQTTASGEGSHAEGWLTEATNEGAHAEGKGAKATGKGAHAEGTAAQAIGEGSHAEGTSTKANGKGSHAEGFFAKADGAYSHAQGYYTTASHSSQHVFGEYNAIDPSEAEATQRGNYVEIVGNGEDGNPSNARTLDWEGNETLAGKLTLGAEPTEDMDATTKHYVDSKIQVLTQAEYDALTVKNPNTLYFIKEG